MSSVMRWRSGVMESSFAKWYVLQAATPCFRTGARDAKARSAVERTARIYRFGGRQIPRSGLVQYRVFVCENMALNGDLTPVTIWQRWGLNSLWRSFASD